MLDLPGHRAAGAAAAAAVRLPALCAHGLHLALVPAVGRQPVRNACFLPARRRCVPRAVLSPGTVLCAGPRMPFHLQAGCEAQTQHLHGAVGLLFTSRLATGRSDLPMPLGRGAGSRRQKSCAACLDSSPCAAVGLALLE